MPIRTHADDPSSLQAIDFLLDEGEPVVAARDGVVYVAVDGHGRGGPSREFQSYANEVEIVHADGTVTQYAHLLKGSVRVKDGQRVPAGEQIAFAGMSGQTDGTHLHFAVGHPLLAPNPAGHLVLQGMVSEPANFEIDGKAVQFQIGDFIKDSNSTLSYQPQSSICRKSQIRSH